ncbi:Tre1 family protein [Schizosaccharomyces pombe]
MTDEKHVYVPPPKDPPSYEEVALHSALNNSVPPNDGEQNETAMEEMEIIEPPSEDSSRFPLLRTKLAAIHEGWESACHSFEIRFASTFHRIPFQFLYLAVIATVIILASYYGYFDGVPAWRSVHHYGEDVLLNYIKGCDISDTRQQVMTLSSIPHLAGTVGDSSLLQMIMNRLYYEKGTIVDFREFYAYLNFPQLVSLSIDGDDSFHPSLIESYQVGGYDGVSIPTPATFGGSPSGFVNAPLVYANRGRIEDFEWLVNSGIYVESSIVLVRANQSDFALATANAVKYNASAILIFEDTYLTSLDNLNQVYPAGPYPSANSLYRGSVANHYYYVGDPLTPGWSAHEETNRISPKDANVLPSIVSIPITFNDGIELLKRLQGHGHLVKDSNWCQDLAPVLSEVWTGSKISSPGLEVNVLQDIEDKQKIINIMAQIDGYESDQILVVGAPRDSWCTGASDSSVGTSLLIDVISTFANMAQDLSWKPRRTIVFASWDARQFNAIGSTEFLEYWKETLEAKAVAYINVDVAVSGDTFTARTVPGLKKVIQRAFDVANEEDEMKAANIITDDFDYTSDLTSFLTFAGIPVVNLAFERNEENPTPMPFLGSCEDTVSWIDTFGSEYWENAARLGKIWSYLILFLANDPVVPYDLEDEINGVGEMLKRIPEIPGANALDLRKINEEFSELLESLIRFEDEIREWKSLMMHNSYTVSVKKHPELEGYNAKLARFERSFLDEAGLPGHEWYKHLIYGPNLRNSHSQLFPSIFDALLYGDVEAAQKEVKRIALALDRAHNEIRFA